MVKSTRVTNAALVIALLTVLLSVLGCAPATTPAAATATPAPATAATATAAPATATAAPQPTVAPTATVPAGGGAQTPAGPADGHWEGIVDVAGQKLTTIVDLTTEAGVLKGTVAFPQQSASGLALEKVSLAGAKVHFEVLPAPRTAIFDGELQGTDKMVGTFEQAGYKGTFELARVQVKPAEPLPYKAEEVKFQNGSVTLAGTLTLPATKGPYPAVVLITGSGPENRDEDIFGFKIFGVIADNLTRKGIAVLRYDDRGVGGSSAGAADDTSETFAGDVAAAVQFLKARAEINPKQIGLLGHSEGGIIAPIVATSSPDVAFVILMAGPGVPGSDILMAQMQLIAKASGTSDAEVARTAALQKRVIDAAISGQGWDEVKADLRKEFDTAAAALSEADRKQIGDVDAWVNNQLEGQVQAMQSPWMRYFLTYDPAPALEKLSVPVLALLGAMDLQVPLDPNEDAITQALTKGGNKDFTVKVFPDANHLFQSAKTGSPAEYATLKPEFTAGFLDTISEWIVARFKPAA